MVAHVSLIFAQTYAEVNNPAASSITIVNDIGNFVCYESRRLS